MGITETIEPGGVFPKADEAVVEGDETMPFQTTKYQSFAAFKTGAERLLIAERDQGCIRWVATREALERQVGPVTLNKVAVIARVRNEVEKLSLIHGLRRSGVNQKVEMTERLVLPRLADLMSDTLDANGFAGPEN